MEAEIRMLRAKLYGKVNAISQELGQVKAEGHNTHSNYDFIGYDQVNARLRNLLPKHNLAIVPAVVSYEERDFANAKNVTIRTIVHMMFRLVDIETGYFEDREGYGADCCTQSKSFGKAVTEAQKRFELKLFHISTRADADPDSETTEIPSSVVTEKVVSKTAPPVPREGALAFIEKHPDLKELCHRLKFKHSEIERIVSDNKFNYEKIKCTMEGVLGFN